MKRYVFDGALEDINRFVTDVVIVGSGAAGLYAALNLDSRLGCIIINKSGVDVCNSMYAQGGIAAAVDEEDSPEFHMRDTLVAGAGLCDEEAVRILVNEGPQEIRRLQSMGVPFDTEDGGRLLTTREGGHSRNRIVHCGGDATGFHLTKRLGQLALQRHNIRFAYEECLTDILTDSRGAAVGVITVDQRGKYTYYKAPNVIIASGGIGRIYRNSTNARCATGDGIAAAIRAGAAVRDMEFVQFHPTALIHPDSNGRFFLISEALRGEGAVLRNRKWEPFMAGVHPMADLAPRDVVSRAIIMEMKKHDLPHVYLDITSRPREFLRKRFPTIYEECMRRDIDIAINWIPVIPAQHYFMGGIKTDIFGRTSIPGLYACGECACTGVHGANRLASNSLLECLVFGRRVAGIISDSGAGRARRADFKTPRKGKGEPFEPDLDSFRAEIRETMTRKCGIIRDGAGLEEGLFKLDRMLCQLESAELEGIKAIETYNMALVGRFIVEAAAMRKKSVGAHYRSDDESQEAEKL